jgi:hypothetical protein
MEAILTHGSVWPLVELDKDLRKQDLQDALTLWQLQRSISKARITSKTHWQRRQVWLQHPHPNFVCNLNSRAVYGTNEHHGSEYDG